MAYASKDGKDTVLFVDKEYVEQQPDIEPSKSEDDSNEKGQSAAYDPETGEINWDCPCKFPLFQNFIFASFGGVE